MLAKTDMELLTFFEKKKESKWVTTLWTSIFILLTIGIFLFLLELGCLKYFGKPGPVTGFCSGNTGDTEGLRGLINRVSDSLQVLIILSPVTFFIWLGLFIGAIWKGPKIRKVISLSGLLLLLLAFGLSILS